jgi:dynein intermediate chain, cytosolic
MLDRPEFVFHSQSDVLSVTFSPFHANLVFGGTYAGQILLWDTRAKQLPVLKTPLSAAGHTHPVYAMKMVGTQNAHNLITSSTDGLVCSWLVDMLAQPQVRPSCLITPRIPGLNLETGNPRTHPRWSLENERSGYHLP